MKKVKRKYAHRRQLGHIYGLDGLRALAIIGVTFFHMFPYTIKGGYLGVSLFFAITGFLLAVTNERRLSSGKYSVSEFYLKRIKRIYPPLLIVLLTTVGIYFFLERQQLGGIRPELLSIVFGYNNWWQIAQNADYFTRITNASPFTHMWFLAIELQFYLIWPLLFAIYVILKKKKGLAAGILYWVVIGVISALLTPLMYRPGSDVTRLYYGTDTRLYGLIFGVILGCLWNHNLLPRFSGKNGRAVAWILFGATLVVTLVAYVLLDGQSPITYRCGMLLMTLLFCLMMVVVTDEKAGIGRVLEWYPLRWIGKCSFEIYLWQYPVIFLFMYKRWTGNVFYYVLELLIIVLLAAWLNRLIQMSQDLKTSKKSSRQIRKELQILLVPTLAAVFFFFSGIAGVITASDTRFSDKDDLAKRLEQNKQLLEASRQGGDLTGESAAGTGAEEPSNNNGTGTLADDGTDAAVNNQGNDLSQDHPEQMFADATTQAFTEGIQTSQDAEDVSSKYVYADPNLTNSAKVSKENVLMIGDSIMLDATPDLLAELPGSYVDAVESRMLETAIDDARYLIDEGYLNQTVVISLGTNGVIYKENAKQMLDLFGPDISIFWVNLFGRTVLWDEESNQLLLDLTKEYPNLTIIDWKSVIKDHPEWLWDDAEHPNIEGSKIYSQLIRESLDSVIDKQNAQEV